jgi:hypothetical protein
MGMNATRACTEHPFETNRAISDLSPRVDAPTRPDFIGPAPGCGNDVPRSRSPDPDRLRKGGRSHRREPSWPYGSVQQIGAQSAASVGALGAGCAHCGHQGRPARTGCRHAGITAVLRPTTAKHIGRDLIYSEVCEVELTTVCRSRVTSSICASPAGLAEFTALLPT